MKEVTLFYLKSCPYCRQAIGWQNEIIASDSRFAPIEIEYIEESENPEIANSYDYYYVPTYYVDGVKLHEGAATREKVAAVLEEALR